MVDFCLWYQPEFLGFGEVYGRGSNLVPDFPECPIVGCHLPFERRDPSSDSTHRPELTHALALLRAARLFEGRRILTEDNMPSTWKARARLVLLLGMAGGLSGCLAAAAAGAGAGTGVYLTTRGAKSIVNGSVSDVATQARAVLKAEGATIDATSMEQSGEKREIKAKKGDLDITVSLERQSATTTNAEVTARKNLAEWDKKYAERILNKIVKKSA